MTSVSGPGDEARFSWEADHVTTAEGIVIPVRATARRPTWPDLPRSVQHCIEGRLGRRVMRSWSTGTGFTPGFASRLTLDDGSDVFVKAASSADDLLHGWPLSDSYRSEIRKLSALPADIGAPPLLWHEDVVLDAEQWVIAAYQFIDGAPPRRPWRPAELALVVDKVAEVSDRLTPPPASLTLDTLETQLMTNLDARLTAIHEYVQDSAWLDQVTALCRDAAPHLHGSTVVHMDLRDDNVIIGTDDSVWFVDWNWPVVGAPWTDVVCLLLSARGDGSDVEQLLRNQSLTRDVPPGAIDALLALLWAFIAERSRQPVPAGSPHLRDHQRWYEQVTRDWLAERLAAARRGRT